MDPLLVVKSKTLGTGIQGTLKAYPEEVEVRTVHSPRNVDVQTARYDDISKVEIDRGTTFADLKIKTQGLLRGETLQVRGLGVEDAEHAKAFIEERVSA
jgi:hypothetical protein